MADKKPTNRDRVSSRTQHNSTVVVHDIFQDIMDVFSGKFNPPQPNPDEGANL
jgi:hypothetical protein